MELKFGSVSFWEEVKTLSSAEIPDGYPNKH